METEFISMPDKSKLLQKLHSGDEDAIKDIFNEVQRLESIIKNYELQIQMSINALNSKTYKRPDIKSV